MANMIPQFQSALSYTDVKDFAYPEFHPLHYGVPQVPPSASVTEEGEPPNDGPPWSEDDDLASPVIKATDVGDRISREYEFSVASADEIHGRAIALFDFTPENDNEVPLKEGQIIWVSYRHGQGWLVAEDAETGETGLVPEEYVELIPNHEARRIQEERRLASDDRLSQFDRLDLNDADPDSTHDSNY
uniref:ARAD1A07392p n=1 Tax=Blastobotrys adeninivorans TaxID=409370 RepID=A0A060T373_BLAAD